MEHIQYMFIFIYENSLKKCYLVEELFYVKNRSIWFLLLLLWWWWFVSDLILCYHKLNVYTIMLDELR